MEEVKIRWQKQTNAWLKANELLSIYEQKSEASIHLLQQKFFSYSKEPTDDVSTHISKLVNLGRKLSLAGELVTDNIVMTKMLMTLPNEYNHFYSAWDSISAGSKTVNNLTSRLLIEESRMQQNKGEVGGQEKSSAFPAKFQNKSSGKNGTYGKGKKEFITKNKVNCFYCGKIRHYKRKCKSYLRSMNGCKISTTDTNLNAFVSESRINNTITNTWVLDSGASDHMSANIEWFSSYEPLKDTQQVTIGDGSNLYAIGKDSPTVAPLHARCGRLFELQVKVEMPSKAECYANIAIEKRLQVWHERLGHQNIQYVRNCLAKHNIDYSAEDNQFVCSDCIIGKQHRQSFNKSETEYFNVGDLIYADICGPMQKDPIGGSKYFLLFKTIVEDARTMICAKNLDVYYGQNTVVYTLNLTGISSQKSKPPYELYYKVVPDIKHLRVFGTVVYTHIPKQKRQKWDPKSPKGIFVGYSNSTKGYRINSTGVQAKDEQTIVDDRNVMVLRDRSTLKKPDRYNIHTFIAKCVNPLNYDETMTGPNKNEWEHTMHDEITSLYENETWSLVDLPQNKIALRNAWVFKTKYKTDGSLDKFKARLVIKGCSQKYGIDYHNSFSPVVRYESTREILIVAAVEKLILRQFDIKTAFLYGDLQEEI
ncbi:hypothetical protein QTP88_012287 [Uroleucon formosanum]